MDWDNEEQRALAQRRLEHYAAHINEETHCPVLIKAAVKEWPALRKWTVKWLAEEHGKQR